MATLRAQEKMAKLVQWANPFLKTFRKASTPPQVQRWVPEGIRVYCVGDIHGCDDLLRQMATRVEADIKHATFDNAVTVFLGDYVDRGFGSIGVLERLVRRDWPTFIIPLAGNHEDLLLAFLNDERVLETWRSLGGFETLHSYGVDVGLAMAQRNFGAVQAAFAARFPESHRQFLKGLKVSTAIGDYFFCHAGVKPGVSLDRQDRTDLLTIRDAFLSSEAEHGKIVVRGHDPSAVPEMRANRIGIDTGAYATGRLTCLVLEKDQRRFLSVNGGGDDVYQESGEVAWPSLSRQ